MDSFRVKGRKTHTLLDSIQKATLGNINVCMCVRKRGQDYEVKNSHLLRLQFSRHVVLNFAGWVFRGETVEHISKISRLLDDSQSLAWFTEIHGADGKRLCLPCFLNNQKTRIKRILKS